MIDAHSQDQTVAICQEYTSQVLLRKWTGMPDQKNFAIQRATSEWVLLLDADECVTPQLRDEIENTLKVDDPLCAGYFIPRKNFYYGKWLQGGGCYPDFQLRFFRNGSGSYGDVEVHPRFDVEGEIGYFQAPMLHYTYPTVGRHFQKQNGFTTRAARERGKTKSHVSSMDLWGRPIFTFLKYFFVRKGMRDGIQGLIASIFASMYTFGKYAKLFESHYLAVKRQNNNGGQFERRNRTPILYFSFGLLLI